MAHSLVGKGEPISVAGAVLEDSMSFGHASDGPDFDTDMSRTTNVSLLRLIALAT